MKDGSALVPQATHLTRRPAASQQSCGDERVRQPGPGEEHYLSVPEPYSRNDWPASWSFHTAPPYGGSTPVPRESLSHLEGRTPWLA